MPKTALIVVDMVQTYDFEGAERLAENVEKVIEPLTDLIQRAKAEGAQVIYVNDNFGDWHSERQRLVDEALAGEHAKLVETIKPDDDATFIVKARHSIFYGTPLDYMLDMEGIDEIVLTGQVTEQCILYSALDAHVRSRKTVIPRDCVAQIDDELADAALKMMETNMNADVVDRGSDVRFSGDREEAGAAT
jgi:nicotinamidase-related amidase